MVKAKPTTIRTFGANTFIRLCSGCRLCDKLSILCESCHATGGRLIIFKKGKSKCSLQEHLKWPASENLLRKSVLLKLFCCDALGNVY